MLTLLATTVGTYIFEATRNANPYNQAKFNSRIWKAAEPTWSENNPRAAMINDLIKTYGNNRWAKMEEISKILGPPDNDLIPDYEPTALELRHTFHYYILGHHPKSGDMTLIIEYDRYNLLIDAYISDDKMSGGSK